MKHCHDCHDYGYECGPDMMNEMYGNYPCGCMHNMPMYPMYPMHPMMHHQMPCHPMYPMMPEMMQPMMGMPNGEMGMMPGMGMMPEMMQPMMGMPMGDMDIMPGMGMMPGMMQPMEGMPASPMMGYPMYPEEYPVAGLEDYYEDEYPESEDYTNFLDIMNAEYPELCDEAKCILKELMEIDFAIIELNLYLNTHPEDRQALAQHNRYVCMREPLVKKLEKLYGPLTPMTKASYPWAWLNQPWPWRIEY